MRTIGLAFALAAALCACSLAKPPPATSGPYLIIAVDRDDAQRPRLEAASEMMAAALRGAAIDFDGSGVNDGAARVHPRLAVDAQRARDAVARAPFQGGATAWTISVSQDGSIEARLHDDALETEIDADANAALIVLRSRIDPDGQKGVRIERAPGPGGRILIMSPAINPQEVARGAVQQAQISFALVDDDARSENGIPPLDVLAEPYPGVGDRSEIVRRHAAMSAVHFEQVRAGNDRQTEAYELQFKFNSADAHTFCRMTTAHVGERFAMLLDDKVITAPTIQAPICGGDGRITGNFTARTAADLAMMMGAGALPTRFTVLEMGVRH